MKAPYYAVIFSSKRASNGDDDYESVAKRMAELAATMPGFLGMESVRDSKSGEGITVSFWDSLENIKAWKQNSEHSIAQKLGKEKFYENFRVRISKVERDYFSATADERNGTANPVLTHLK